MLESPYPLCKCTPRSYSSKLPLSSAVTVVPTVVDFFSNFLCFCNKHHDQKCFQRKRFIWLSCYSPFSREECQNRKSARACNRNCHAGMLLTDLLLELHSFFFLIQHRPTYLGIMVLPTVIQVFLYMSSF